MCNRYLLIVCLAHLCLVSGTAWAQSPADQLSKFIPKVAPLSPNAASLGKYGDYQVNLFTGVPQISIPLHDITSGSLSLPISLSYHAAGVRYTDQASWVGLGWTLNVGGLVSRKVGGLPDEDRYWAGTLKQAINTCVDRSYYESLTNGGDMEPDVFSYTMPSGSGKFVLAQNTVAPSTPTPVLIPTAPVQVVPDLTASTSVGTIRKFDITDANGVLYRFGKNASNADVIEYTSGQNGGQSYNYETSWMLTQMTAPNSDDQISFSYTLGYATYSDISHQVTVTDLCQNGYNDGTAKHTPSISGITEISNYYTAGQQQLTQILFENGKVDFVLASRTDQPQSKSLDQIKIYNRQGLGGTYKLIKTVKFIYSYFKDKTGTNDLRLKLDGVQVLDASSQVQQKYGLEYHTNQFSWDRANFSDGRDLWGYYNGKESLNTDLIPRQTIPYVEYANASPATNTAAIGGATDRKTNPLYMTEGVLKRITFPTGGYTEFDFETNRYLEAGNTVAYAGGLRVTQIRSHDGFGAGPVVKTYKYGLNESGNGQKNFFQNLYFYSFDTKYTYSVSGERGSYRYRAFFSSSLLDLDSYDGSPVVYTYLTEYYGDAASNIGKIIYTYDDGAPAGDVARIVQGSSKVWKESYHWKRGFLTEKKVYDKGGRIVSKTVNRPTYLRTSLNYVALLAYKYYTWGGTPSDQCVPFNGGSTVEFFADKFTLPSGVSKLASSTEYVYDQDDAANARNVQTSTAYQYNADYLQVTESKQATSNLNDEVVVTRMRYPPDYGAIAATATGDAAGIRMLQSKNILTLPVEKYVLRQNSDGSGARVVSGAITSFKQNPNGLTQVVPNIVYMLEATSGVTGYTPSTVTTGNLSMPAGYKPRITFHQYNATGELVEISKSDDVRSCYVWGYGNTLPIGQVSNASASQIACTSFEGNANEGGWTFASTAADAGAKTGRYCFNNATGTVSGTIGIGKFTLSYWAQGAVTLSLTPTRSTTGPTYNGWTYYEHTYDRSTATATATLTLTPGTIKLDELRLHPEGALMTTFTHDPGVGMTSQTDAAGITTYYQYDESNRLELVRDQRSRILKNYYYHYKQ